jgi:WD40 repeat protein
MLNKSNITALVGGGNTPKFSKNKIIIYDNHQELVVSQIRFNSDIINVKIRTDSIIGLISNRIYILNINTLEIVDEIEIDIINNHLYGISYIHSVLILAFPQNKSKGKIQIEKYCISTKINKKIKTEIVNAHESNVVYLAVNNNGTLLASASEKGPHIRLFDTSNGALLAELKKGKNGTMTHISFEQNNEYIGYTNNIGKIYIYDINKVKKFISSQENGKNDKKQDKKEDIKNEIHKVKEKAIVKFRINETNSIMGFIQPKSIVIITSGGKFYKASYDLKIGKKCNLLVESFIKVVNK